MRALIQRVASASVAVDSTVVGRIGRGLAILVGVARDDDEDDARYLVEKTANLRIFPRDEGPDETDPGQRSGGGEGGFDISALDCGAEILLVSQFTLHAGTRKGRRPSFTEAAPPEQAEALFGKVVELFRETGLTVATGRFRAYMRVDIHNDGPVTIMVDSADRRRSRSGGAKE